jgi:uncharacterized phage protein (TIGR01671 family)
MKNLKFRAWDGQRMHKNIAPFKWDCVISRQKHRCLSEIEENNLENPTKAKFEVDAIIKPDIQVTQWTGLVDNDGEEIFDGDLLTLSYGIPPTVAKMRVFAPDGIFLVECYNATPKESRLHELCSDDLRVVGNIFQNPELLEEWTKTKKKKK